MYTAIGYFVKQLTALIDMNVTDERGSPVGRIDEMILNGRTGRVDTVVLKRPDRTRFCVNWTDLLLGDDGIVIRSHAGA